jgi:hypothetical protein
VGDVIHDGPWIDLLRGMGARGVADRYKVSGEALTCVCLLHGASDARVLFTVGVPMLGPGVYLKPVVLVHIQVLCYPWCGYRLTWA